MLRAGGSALHCLRERMPARRRQSGVSYTFLLIGGRFAWVADVWRMGAVDAARMERRWRGSAEANGAVACAVIGVFGPRGHGVPTVRDTLRIRVSYGLAVAVAVLG